MRKAVLISAISVLAVTVAWAAFFKSASASVNNAGALVVSFDERGLGNENITYALTADATALYACINKGGKNPSAANKQAFNDDVSGGGSFEPKNGRVVASLTAGPISAGTFSCPSGQNLVLASVTYSNVLLVDTTNNVQIAVTVGTFTRTFFVV